MWIDSPAPATARHADTARGTPQGPWLVLANPGSGEHDATQTRELLQGVFEGAGRSAEFVALDDPSGLPQASDEAARRAVAADGVLVAVGGDGTINTVAQAALRNGCALGVIPQGTFNLFARNYGIPQTAQAAAQALLRAVPRPVQVGWVNDQLFLVNASLGLYPQLLEDREAMKAKLGRHRWVALLSAVRTLIGWRSELSLDIEQDGRVERVRTPTLFVGNNHLQLERVGLPPETIARVGSGRMVAVVAAPAGHWRLLTLLLQGVAGRLGAAPEVDAFAFRTMQVWPRSRRPVKAAVDGEVRRLMPPLRFAVSAEPLLLMMPEPGDRVDVA